MRPYWLLKARMYERDAQNTDIANLLGRSATYVSERLTGKKFFTLDDAYKILKYLDLPMEEIFVYFPPDKGGTTARRKGA